MDSVVFTCENITNNKRLEQNKYNPDTTDNRNKENEFEQLLSNHFETSQGVVDQIEDEKSEDTDQPKNAAPNRLKANKNATLDDFIEMVGKVVTVYDGNAEGKNYNIDFQFDEGIRIKTDPEMPINNPYITYKVIERVPDKELKPRERESIYLEDTGNKNDMRPARIYGQKFKCIVQFDIIASEYKQASEVMNIFEDIIFSYTHYFKKNGVGEILFKKHYTDSTYDIYRDTVSVRSLQYYIEIEKQFVMFDDIIENVNVQTR